MATLNQKLEERVKRKIDKLKQRNNKHGKSKR
jgi:hypothetical protein